MSTIFPPSGKGKSGGHFVAFGFGLGQGFVDQCFRLLHLRPRCQRYGSWRNRPDLPGVCTTGGILHPFAEDEELLGALRPHFRHDGEDPLFSKHITVERGAGSLQRVGQRMQSRLAVCTERSKQFWPILPIGRSSLTPWRRDISVTDFTLEFIRLSVKTALNSPEILCHPQNGSRSCAWSFA